MSIGVIFDMDGVLVDSARPHLESWQRMAATIGRDMPEETFKKTFGRQNRAIIPLVYGIEDPAEVERLSDLKEAFYREIIREDLPAMDGAAELVESLATAGVKLAIGSSGASENVEATLAGMRIARHFHASITAREVTRGKPDPQVFILAAEALGLAPEECAVIEDAPHGIDAALAAGAAAIGFVCDYPAETLRHAHKVVTSLRDLSPEVIAQTIRYRQSVA